MTRATTAVVLVCLLAGSAHAVLCRTKGGALSVREACKRKETAPKS